MQRPVKPYISFITNGRNDNYGGDQSKRLEFSIKTLLDQLERYQIESEWIFVDWNSPENGPAFYDLLKWPSGHDYCTIRFLRVPPKYHKRFKYHDRVGFAGPQSVNVGIRRSRGEFVLVRVSDAVYSDALVQFLAEKKLSRNMRYRAIRCDVSPDVLSSGASTREFPSLCGEKIVHCYNSKPGGMPDPVLATDACGDFQLMSKIHADYIRGFWEKDVAGVHVDSILSYASYGAGAREVVLPEFLTVFKIAHGNQLMKRVQQVTPKYERFINRLPVSEKQKNSWIEKRRAKLKEKYGYRTPNYEIKGIPVIQYQEYVALCQDLAHKRLSPVLNNAEWGLGDVDIPECTLFKAKWEV